MKLEVKKLSHVLIDDYIHFHKNIAFTDNPDCAGCFCVWYHWEPKLDIERQEYEKNGGKEFKLNLSRKYIKENKLRGYLAYVDGEVVGWCNANDRGNYTKLNEVERPDLWEDYKGEKCKSIICFTIAPHMRRKGLSKLILKEIIADSKEEGYDYIEAYPGTGKPNNRSYHGAPTIYEKNGFSKLKRNQDVVRLMLK